MFEPIKIEKIPQEKFNPKLIEQHRVKHTDKIPLPDVVLKVNNQVVSTRKNIFGITGKAKVGKSFLMTLINGAVLQKGDNGVLASFLPAGKDKIVYIDTEQSEYHVSLVLNRIKSMVDEYKMDNILMYAFDAVPTAQRMQYTEWLICNTQEIGLVIIDGISDLVMSVNDEIIATETADWMRRMATVNDIAIGYVLHQNPSDNAKMRGHLGTVLMNKSETVIQISSSKDDESVKLVQTTQTRNRKPDDWSFEIVDGMPTIMDVCYSEPKIGRKLSPVLNDLQKYDILLEVYKDVKKSEGFGYTVLNEKIREVYIYRHGQVGLNAIKSIQKYCQEMGWIVQDGTKKPWLLYPIGLTV